MGATLKEMDTMRHMLGAASRSPGFRNYGAYESDDGHLAAMVAKGLVSRGAPIQGGLVYYHVTAEWAEMILGAK